MDEDVAKKAQQQFGLISRDQALGLGLSRSALHRRLKAKQLLRFLPGVYRMPGTVDSVNQRIMGACLAVGPGGSRHTRPRRTCGTSKDTRRRWSSSSRLAPPSARSKACACICRATIRPSARCCGVRFRRPTWPGRWWISQRSSTRVASNAPSTRRGAFATTCPTGSRPTWTNSARRGARERFAWIAQRVALFGDSWGHHHSRQSFDHDREQRERLAACGWTPVELSPRLVKGGSWLAALTRHLREAG